MLYIDAFYSSWLICCILLLHIICIVDACSKCWLLRSCFQQVHPYSQGFTVPKNTGSCFMICRLKPWLSSGSLQWGKENEIWLHLKIIFKNGAESGTTCEGKRKLLNLKKWIRHYSTSMKHYDSGAITVPSIQATASQCWACLLIQMYSRDHNSRNIRLLSRNAMNAPQSVWGYRAVRLWAFILSYSRLL